MRISDWSSDVCSSDLQSLRLLPRGAGCCRLVFGRRSKEPLGCSMTDYGEPEDGDLVEAAEKLAIPEEVQEAVRTLLTWAGEDPSRGGLHDTPARVGRAGKETCPGYEEGPQLPSRVRKSAG